MTATGERPLAIDCWLDPTWRAADLRPEFLARVARDYFKREREKYPNLYTMTSAYAPKYLPQELIQFMNTCGGHRCCSPPTIRCSRWSDA